MNRVEAEWLVTYKLFPVVLPFAGIGSETRPPFVVRLFITFGPDIAATAPSITVTSAASVDHLAVPSETPGVSLLLRSSRN
ncbi:hypothetical protein ACCO45_010393 [Purpureocillium lilacinum]|uniref:Uncharacterized protein n=1 Tax=Purpureocillium lilacinum TaxID=33203 RepID=A0ACC4DHQ9_PURLI